MSNYLSVHMLEDAPCGLICTASGGSGGSTQSVSLLLVAWDDPEEKDVTLARYINKLYSGAAFGGGPSYYSIYEGLTYRSGGASDDTISLSWTPPRRRPHHYAVYIQTAAATWDDAALGNKILPATGTVNGNIPGYATSASFANITARHANLICGAEFGSEDVTNHYMYPQGNLCGLIDPNPGTTILEYPGGTSRTCTAAKLMFSDYGERTRLTLNAGPNTGQGGVILNGGVIYSLAASHAQVVSLSLITGFDHTPRDTMTRDLNGRPIARSFLDNAHDDSITVSVPYTGISLACGDLVTSPDTTGGGLIVLNKWRKWRIPVRLYVIDSPSALDIALGTEPALGADMWIGYIEDVNDYQLPYISSFDEVQVRFRLTRQYSREHDFGGRDITNIDIATKTWTISGTPSTWMIAGNRMWVQGTTDNDGVYVISSVTASVNSVAIVTTTAPVSTTADGAVYGDAWQ